MVHCGMIAESLNKMQRSDSKVVDAIEFKRFYMNG